MSILSIPDYRGGNPYQSNLAAELAEDVTYGREDALFPVCQALLWDDISVVHLHWLNSFVSGETLFEKLTRLALFMSWLTLVKLQRLPIVWTVHNVRFHSSNYPRIERALKRLFIVYLCDRCIVHCDAVREEFIETYDLPPSVQRRIDTIPHGHYLDNYENEISGESARERLGLPDSSTVFLFFGVISPYKGVLALVNAFRELSVEESDLVIAGSPKSASFERAVRTGCVGDDRIHTDFRYVPDDEVQQFMNAADAVVLPYRDIATSGSAILAMSFGNALVVPRLGCLPDLLDDDGAVFYDPDRPDGLVSALETAAGRALDEMGTHNRSVVADLDWTEIADRTQESYEKAKQR